LRKTGPVRFGPGGQRGGALRGAVGGGGKSLQEDLVFDHALGSQGFGPETVLRVEIRCVGHVASGRDPPRDVLDVFVHPPNLLDDQHGGQRGLGPFGPRKKTEAVFVSNPLGCEGHGGTPSLSLKCCRSTKVAGHVLRLHHQGAEISRDGRSSRCMNYQIIESALRHVMTLPLVAPVDDAAVRAEWFDHDFLLRFAESKDEQDFQIRAEG